MRKWQPFAATGTQGVWMAVQNMFRTRSGSYYTAMMLDSASINSGPVTPGTTLRAWAGQLPDDTAAGYIGTTTKLYGYYTPSGFTGFTDLSRGGGYTNTAADWSFGQFGKISIACNRIDATQFRDATGVGAFADLATAPKAAIAVTQQSQILLFDLNDGAEKPDYFIACAPGDYTTWSGASATGPNPIWNRPGRITAAVAYRDYVLVFKRSSVYRLTYTGTSLKWKVELIAVGRGAYGKHDAITCGDKVVFSGPSGIWVYDGSSFSQIGEGGPIVNPNVGTLSAVTANASFYTPFTGSVFFQYAGALLQYQIESDGFGYAIAQNKSALLPGTFRMMGGEFAAVTTLTTTTGAPVGSGFPDTFILFDLSQVRAGSGFPPVVFPFYRWGTGNGTAASPAYLVGSIEGTPGRDTTNFAGLDVIYTQSYPSGNSSFLETAGATGLTCEVRTGATLDDTAFDPTSAAGLTATSSTAQRRFDFEKTAVHAQFKIIIADNAGHVELVDYTPRTTPAGTF